MTVAGEGGTVASDGKSAAPRSWSLPALQLALLSAAAARVRAGGVLTYATCSVLRAENEDVVAAFLASEAGEGFVRADVLEAPGILALGEVGQELVRACHSPLGDFRSTPAPGLFDGHFCARLVRVR